MFTHHKPISVHKFSKQTQRMLCCFWAIVPLLSIAQNSISDTINPAIQDGLAPPISPNSVGALMSVGTGFAIGQGYIITALHVIQNKQHVHIGPNSLGRWSRATVIQTDTKLDLALLSAKINAPALHLSANPVIPYGIEIFAIGFPQPRLQGLSKKISQGIVNGYRSDADQKIPTSFMQINATISQGNSGGPIFGPDGTVVGIVQRQITASKAEQINQPLQGQVNFALKSSAIVQFLQTSPVAIQTREMSLETVKRPHQIYAENHMSVVAIIAHDTPPVAAPPQNNKTP